MSGEKLALLTENARAIVDYHTKKKTPVPKQISKLAGALVNYYNFRKELSPLNKPKLETARETKYSDEVEDCITEINVSSEENRIALIEYAIQLRNAGVLKSSNEDSPGSSFLRSFWLYINGS
jgi:hypothetical protein